MQKVMLLQVRDENWKRMDEIVHFDYAELTVVKEMAQHYIEKSGLYGSWEGWEDFICDPSNPVDYKHHFYVAIPEGMDLLGMAPENFHQDIKHFHMEFQLRTIIEIALLKVIEDYLLAHVFEYDQAWLAPYDLKWSSSVTRHGRAKWEPYNYDEDFTYVGLVIWLELEDLEGNTITLPKKWYHSSPDINCCSRQN